MFDIANPKILKILESGGVISFPMDTVSALACDATNDNAVKSIYKIKNRDRSKPIAVFVKDFEDLKSVTKPNKFLGRFKNEILSGKLTVILEVLENSSISKFINTKNNTVGIRIPNHELTQQILSGFGKPIAATSVNLSGEEELIDSSKISKSLMEKIDFVVGGKSDNSLASTIIDLTLGKPKILRVGALDIDINKY